MKASMSPTEVELFKATERIAELERVGHATLLREIDKDKRISELEAKICSMNDAGHKLFDENKRLKHATLLREIGER